ncbi:hypothetical protein D3C87_2013920 [compost metagenome]
MGRIGADQSRLPRWWLGQQIAADVSRRQPAGAYASEHQVREILTNTATTLQYLHQWRCHLGCFGVKGEFAEDFFHQRLYAE